MNCFSFTRLLAWRRRRMPATPAVSTELTSSVPNKQASVIQQEQAVNLENACSTQAIDSIPLSLLAFEGSCTLAFTEIPIDERPEALLQTLRTAQGYISQHDKPSEINPGLIDILIHFNTAMEAAQATSADTVVSLRDGTIRRLAPCEINDEDSNQHPNKKAKTENSTSEQRLVCAICGDTLAEEYSKPCILCSKNWCYSCLKGQFVSSLGDPEHFPALCCQRILHYDVVKGHLPEADYQQYKARFEERYTAPPIYCANPRCSTFLPPRLVQPKPDGQIECIACKEVTCSQCKVVVNVKTSDHDCSTAMAEKTFMKQFEYKQCLKCGAAVARMFGCSHMRCICGAHWCWDCRRPINICWARPCPANRESEDEYLSDDEPEEEDADEATSETENIGNDGANEHNTEGTAQDLHRTGSQTANTGNNTTSQADTAAQDEESEPVGNVDESNIENVIDINEVSSAMSQVDSSNHSEVITDTEQINTGDQRQEQTLETGETALDTIATDNSSTDSGIDRTFEPTEEVFVNLDHPEEADDWNNGVWDFGDEPGDEAWDSWGCDHHFSATTDEAFWKDRQHWIPDHETARTTEKVRHVDCLRCYQPVAFTLDASEDMQKPEMDLEGEQHVHAASDSQVTLTGSMSDRGQGQKKGKSKRSTTAPAKLFTCNRCGIVNCFGCMKITEEEKKALLKNRNSE